MKLGERRDGSKLARDLRSAGVAEVDDSRLGRAMYAADASLYRVVPSVVVAPSSPDELAAVVEVAAEHDVPVTARGAGTSIAGNAVGTGVVIDFSRHMNRLIEVDPERRIARVQPGVVLDDLQLVAGRHGLRVGPEPSTHDRATIGGMIGNNACGSRALGYGRTIDHVCAAEIVTGDGGRVQLGAGRTALRATNERGLPVTRAIEACVHSVHGHVHDSIQAEFGRFPRQVSGYALDHLISADGPDLAKAFVGSEGTLGLLTEATIGLVPVPSTTTLVVISFDDMPSAGHAVPELLAHDPIAVEGLDVRITEAVRSRHGDNAIPLPEGASWLFVEVAGDDPDDVLERACAVAATAPGRARVVTDNATAAHLWSIREAGAGLSSTAPSGRPAHAGWEDAAVPVPHLGDYLRDFDGLMVSAGVTGMPYGHFGDGCVHIRIDWPLRENDGPQRFRSFIEAAAELTASYGGSMSGEHGDGRARSELLDRMYSPEAMRAMAAFKHAFDPNGRLNPGVLIDPAPFDMDLRAHDAQPVAAITDGFSFQDDGGDLVAAAHRCTGVGACIADRTDQGQVMCPSYVATGMEKDSTRGRAHVLQEMLRGELISGGVQSSEVHDALDLCLSCKACSSDCPTGVDMAKYKAEVLHRRYARGRRPRSHTTLGRLPDWLQRAAVAPGAANALMSIPGVGSLARRLAGIDPRRGLPSLAPTTFHRSLSRRPPYKGPADKTQTAGSVQLWIDTFTNHFAPHVAVAAIRVLEDAGYEVDIVGDDSCCGLTWISTGQLPEARSRLVGLLDSLIGSDDCHTPTPIVGLEPSCVAVLRDDIADLLPDDDRVPLLQSRVRTLAELLMTRRPGWSPPRLEGRTIIVQPHCHHHAVMGTAADRALLTATGASVRMLGGCCGLAGNWGMEADHYDTSVAIAENQLLPTLRNAPTDAIVLADGFSCRAQVAELDGGRVHHLAELLAPKRSAGH